jgi:pimeloyl-ACP methyl ester carboxylesterase
MQMELPGQRSLWFEGFVKYEFAMDGKTVTVICPPRPLDGLFWAWKGEFRDCFPALEIALLQEGFFIVHLNFPDQFGSPAAVAEWNELYALLTGRHGFHRRVALIGLSRGSLYCYQWAVSNPYKVACIYGDAPVCDMRSWPGGKGKGLGSSTEWQKVMEVFGFASEAEALAYPLNPVDRLAPLAAASIPIMHVFGDADKVVPWEENTGVLAERYRALGGKIELIAKPGCDHHPHGLEDPSPIVAFIRRYTVENRNI